MTTTSTMPGAKPVYSAEPRDLHALRPWFNMIRRLRRAAALGGGSYSAIRIVVIVSDGKPVNWTAPKVTTIEPRADAQALDLLLNVLGE